MDHGGGGGVHDRPQVHRVVPLTHGDVYLGDVGIPAPQPPPCQKQKFTEEGNVVFFLFKKRETRPIGLGVDCRSLDRLPGRG